MLLLRNLFGSAFHLFYPHQCTGCASDLLSEKDLLCLNCITELPHTNFASFENNYIENIFRGRMEVKAAHSQFYFSKGKLVQHLIHELKYKANQQIGFYLGEIVGKTLLAGSRFMNIDFLVPLPLYPDKELKRGYNQSAVICNGIEASTKIPLLSDNVIRKYNTETQTRKHRAARWQNVASNFDVKDPSILAGKNILLVDDVITTGASLEACGQAILAVAGTTVSIASLAHASK